MAHWNGCCRLKKKLKQTGAGALYCIDNNRKIVKKISGLSIPNGLVWSPDNSRMYHIDCSMYAVQSYQFDEQTRNISPEGTVIHIQSFMGVPDGMTIDEEGMLWIVSISFKC